MSYTPNRFQNRLGDSVKMQHVILPQEEKNTKVRMSPAVARDAPLPQNGDYILWDVKTKYLGLRIHAGGAKVWIVQKKLGKSPCRYNLGAFPEMTYHKALSKVAEVVAKIAAGIDPNLEKRQHIREAAHARRQESFTVTRCFEEYIADKKSSGKPPKPLTVIDWERSLARIKAGSLATTSLAELTGGMLATYYDASAKRAKRLTTNGGRTQAGRDLRYLRAAYSLCSTKFKLDLPEVSPFEELNKLREGWYLVQARTRIVAEAEGNLESWWKAVEKLRPPGEPEKTRDVLADYLQLSLLWGVRRGELLSLKWAMVSLEDGMVTLPKTSTKNERIHLIPITRYARQLLEKRHQLNAAAQAPSEWVFPSPRKNSKGERSHIIETKRAIAAVKKPSGIEFAEHDLRRSFATLFKEIEVSDYTVKRALNHAAHDVTSKHYLRSRIKALRPLYQQYEDKLLIEAGVMKEEAVTVVVGAEEFARFQIWLAAQAATAESDAER